MLVSIIVPIYNSEKYLNECLDSLINQTYPDIEIILVNDGSKDSSLKICEIYKSNFNNLYILNKENEGVSAARNDALKIAKGEYIAFCDSDDVMAPKQIEILVDNLKKTDSDMSVCSYINFLDQISKCKYENSIPILLRNDDMYNAVIRDKTYSGYLWNKLFKKSLINQNMIRFRNNIHILEDEIFILEYLKNCKSIVVCKNRLYGYRNNPIGALNQKINEKKLTSIVGRETVFNILVLNQCSEEILKNSWNDLIKEYAYCFKDILFAKDLNRIYWREIIERGYKKHKKLYAVDDTWNNKEKIYLFLLDMYSRTKLKYFERKK